MPVYTFASRNRVIGITYFAQREVCMRWRRFYAATFALVSWSILFSNVTGQYGRKIFRNQQHSTNNSLRRTCASSVKATRNSPLARLKQTVAEVAWATEACGGSIRYPPIGAPWIRNDLRGMWQSTLRVRLFLRNPPRRQPSRDQLSWRFSRKLPANSRELRRRSQKRGSPEKNFFFPSAAEGIRELTRECNGVRSNFCLSS